MKVSYPSRSHWVELPLWTVLRSREEYGGGDLPLLTVVSEYGVGTRDLKDGRAPSEDLSGYKVVHNGDLVVNKLWARFGAYGVSRLNGVISPAYWVLEPHSNRIVPRFLHYLLRSAPYRAEVWRRSKDMPPNGFDLPWSQFRTIRVVVPTISDQVAIADYLDAETARIDALIDKKRRLMILLKERFIATVEHVVWSGVERYTPLMHLTERGRPIMYGIVLPGPNLPSGIPIVKGGDVASNRLLPDLLCRTSPIIEAPYARARVKGGDLLFAIRGGIGDVEIAPDELAGANITQDVARVAPALNIDARWLRFALQTLTAQRQVAERTTGATIRGLNIGELKRILVPGSDQSRREGDTIALLEAEAHVSGTTSRMARQIRLLAEHQQALVTAAVTGELEVPGIAA